MFAYLQSGETRDVTHVQFVSWPDYGVPRSAECFLAFMLHVRRVQEERTRELGAAWTGHKNGPPIAIHCSAGIGRTGKPLITVASYGIVTEKKL